jgi:hypothetical protein
MRIVLGLVFSLVAAPVFAQTILRSEPLVMAPYEVVLVRDGSCSIGKLLKVTGAIRGLNRKKVCVARAEQAALGQLE